MSSQLSLLGQFEVRVQGRRWPVTGNQRRAALALMALHANEPVPVALMVSRLWSEDDVPVDPRASLRSAVAELRSQLSRNAGCPFEIITSDWSCTLVAPEGSVDVLVWRQLRRDAERSLQEHRPEEAAAALHRALELWGSSPLDGLEAWPELVELREERLDVIEERVAIDLVLGRAADVIDELWSLADAEPLRERRHELLMRALVAQGRTADALRVYDRARAALAEGWGIDPGPELRSLRDAVMAGDGAAGGGPARFRASGVVMFHVSRLPVAEGDPEELALVLDALTDHVVRHVGTSGGWVVPLHGSAVLALFASRAPAVPAVRSALAVRDAVGAVVPGHDALSLHLRAAVALGEVSGVVDAARGNGLVLDGRALDVCSELLPLARPGEVIVSAAVARAASGRIVCGPSSATGAFEAVAVA